MHLIALLMACSGGTPTETPEPTEVVAPEPAAAAIDKRHAALFKALPAEMTYVANSAVGPGSDISFSIDGKTFAKVADLKVSENGATRAARPDEVRFIRWTFATLPPGAQALARFRAVVK